MNTYSVSNLLRVQFEKSESDHQTSAVMRYLLKATLLHKRKQLKFLKWVSQVQYFSLRRTGVKKVLNGDCWEVQLKSDALILGGAGEPKEGSLVILLSVHFASKLVHLHIVSSGS